MKRILIDPGHGGNDPGAVGNGLEEKDLAFKYSLTLKYLLEKLGYYVSLTRWGDTNPSLEKRGQSAVGYDAFISLHFNAGQPTAKGMEVWYHDTKGQQLAKYVEAEMKKVATTWRGSKKDTAMYKTGFAVLRVAASKGVPAILLEIEFITNKVILNLISDDNRINLMTALANGIDQFLKGGK